jgi:hypothetical protein
VTDEPLLGAVYLLVVLFGSGVFVWLTDRWSNGKFTADLVREQEDSWPGDLICLAVIAWESALKKLGRPDADTSGGPEENDPPAKKERVA